MKYYSLIVSLCLIVLILVSSGDSVKFSTLERNSDVMVEGLYPVFWIPIPEGVTEIQIRASVTNFQPDEFNFYETDNSSVLYRYIRDGFENGKPRYLAHDPDSGEPVDLYCTWQEDDTGGHWNFGYAGIKGRRYNLPEEVDHPTACTFFYSGEWVDWGGDYSGDYDEFTAYSSGDGQEYSSPQNFARDFDPDEMFIYRWCSTGQDEDLKWGTDIVDGDAKLFFSGQNGNDWTLKEWVGNSVFLLDEFDEFILDEDGNKTPDPEFPTSLTGQTQPAGTPGRFVMFQPSRSAHLFEGGRGDWMRQGSKNLQWIVQFENAEGYEVHPDGSQVWSVMHPVEWRKERKTLTED